MVQSSQSTNGSCSIFAVMVIVMKRRKRRNMVTMKMRVMGDEGDKVMDDVTEKYK